MWKAFALCLVIGGLGLFAGVERVQAQAGIDRFHEEVCQDNPHSEACICVDVRNYGLYPLGFDGHGNPVLGDDPTDGLPVFDRNLGVWRGVPPVYDEDKDEWVGGNLEFQHNDEYGKHCVLSYVREDLRRLWYFVAAVSGLLAAMTLGWLGFQYMQESASGGDLSRSRAAVIRVVLGMIIVGFAYVAWETTSGLLVTQVETWSLDHGLFYRLD